FITKPVRFDELLDWLTLRLGLQWLAGPATPSAPTPPMPVLAGPPPSREALQALLAVVRLGYPRGVQRVLSQIEAEHPACIAWLAPQRALAKAFQFDRMAVLIQEALAG
ncbi:MAG TPA: hypothetical protein VK439_02480, partial [Rubrivivax sp.]|nr:hypothetical protein [Rubrivivax sp.]